MALLLLVPIDRIRFVIIQFRGDFNIKMTLNNKYKKEYYSMKTVL